MTPRSEQPFSGMAKMLACGESTRSIYALSFNEQTSSTTEK